MFKVKGTPDRLLLRKGFAKGRSITQTENHLYIKQNQAHLDKKFIESLGKQLGYHKLEDWYKSSREIIQINGGERILSYYNNSLIQILKKFYPEHEWLEWKFSSVPNGFWEDSNNQLKFLDWLGKELGFKSMTDWYQITAELIYKHGGEGLLLKYFNNSPIQMLQTLYPTIEWIPWKFSTHVPNGYWEDPNNRIKFVSWLGKELGYASMEHWYQLTTDVISKHGGRGLLNGYFNGSAIQMIQTLYPNHEWIPWKFAHVPNGYWEDSNNQIKFVEWLKKEMNYDSMEDWYHITQETIYKNGGKGLLHGYFHNSPIQMLQKLYPNYEWIPSKFKKKPKSVDQTMYEKKFKKWLLSSNT